MSSHHIVRENQEPALIVQDINVLDSEFLGQLLEWSPTIISDRSNFDTLLSQDIKVDVLFSDITISSIQEHVKVILLQSDFLTDSLHYLISKNHKAVNILCSQLPDNIYLFADKINIVIFTPSLRSIFVRKSFEKWKPKGDKIFVDEKSLVSFVGLNALGNNVFETIADGFVQLYVNTDDFVLIGEEL